MVSRRSRAYASSWSEPASAALWSTTSFCRTLSIAPIRSSGLNGLRSNPSAPAARASSLLVSPPVSRTTCGEPNVLRCFSSLQKARPLLPGRLTSSTTSAGRQKRASSAPSSAEPASSIAYSSAASVVLSRSRRPGSSSTRRIRCRPVGQMLVAGRLTAGAGSATGSSSLGLSGLSSSDARRPKSSPTTPETNTHVPSATRTQKIQPVMCALLACYQQVVGRRNDKRQSFRRALRA
jgi:hypothetical protein